MKSAGKQSRSNNSTSRVRPEPKTVAKTVECPSGEKPEIERLLVVGEEASEFEAFEAKIIGELSPVGPVEKEIVDSVVILMWRQKRVPRMEAAVIAARDAATFKDSPGEQKRVRRDHLASMAARYLIKGKQDEQASDEPEQEAEEEAEEEDVSADPEEAISRAIIHDVENGNVLGQLLRNEASLSRTLEHKLNTLGQLQARRQRTD